MINLSVRHDIYEENWSNIKNGGSNDKKKCYLAYISKVFRPPLRCPSIYTNF